MTRALEKSSLLKTGVLELGRHIAVGWHVAVDFETDADFDQNRRGPSHSVLHLPSENNRTRKDGRASVKPMSSVARFPPIEELVAPFLYVKLFLPPPVRAIGVPLPKLRWCPSAALPFRRQQFSLLPSRPQPRMIRAQRGL